MRIVSRGALKLILADHIAEPSKLTYGPLPQTISRTDWLTLDEQDRDFYVPDESSALPEPPSPEQRESGERTVRYMTFVLPPGDYDAFVIR